MFGKQNQCCAIVAVYLVQTLIENEMETTKL